MAEMILPGVYIEVRPEALIVAGAVTVGNIGIVGTACKGPVGEVEVIGSISEAREIFGGSDPLGDPVTLNCPLTLIRALELAYANGASTVFAVRVAKDAQNAQFTVNSETAGKKAAVLVARTKGSWGNRISINVWAAEECSYIENQVIEGDKRSLNRKQIDKKARNKIKVYLDEVGQTKDFVPIYDGTPNKGEVKINDSNGELEFSNEEKPSSNDKILASYFVLASNSCKVTIRCGGITESYTVADGCHLVDLVKEKSTLVDGSDGDYEKPNAHEDAKDFKEFRDGMDGACAKPSDYDLGLELLLNENAHIIVAAGQDENVIGDKLTSHVEKASNDKIKRYRIGVVGSESKAELKDILSHNRNSDRVIFVAPGIKTTDAASGNEVTLPGSYAAAAIAGVLSARSPHTSLTNKTVSVAGLETKFTPSELEQLIESRVLAMEMRQGIKIVKAITTSTNTAWHQITTRRIVDYAEFGVRSASESYIGLLNNDRVRKALKGSINGFLAGMVGDEMLISYDLDVTATRDEEIRGIAKVTMVLRPTFSIDFIKVVMFLG